MSTGMSEHIPFAQLNAYVEGRLLPAEHARVTAHLGECAICAAEVTWLHHTGQITGAGKAETSKRQERHLTARLLFDSAQHRPAFAVRGTQAPARQLLYRAGEFDLDIRLTPTKTAWQIAGQLLGRSVPGHVTLLNGDDMVYALLNQQCEFKLPPVPAGIYRLVLHVEDAEVEVDGLSLGV